MEHAAVYRNWNKKDKYILSVSIIFRKNVLAGALYVRAVVYIIIIIFSFILAHELWGK